MEVVREPFLQQKMLLVPRSCREFRRREFCGAIYTARSRQFFRVLAEQRKIVRTLQQK